jgi:hypothetical protein
MAAEQVRYVTVKDHVLQCHEPYSDTILDLSKNYLGAPAARRRPGPGGPAPAPGCVEEHGAEEHRAVAARLRSSARRLAPWQQDPRQQDRVRASPCSLGP